MDSAVKFCLIFIGIFFGIIVLMHLAPILPILIPIAIVGLVVWSLKKG